MSTARKKYAASIHQDAATRDREAAVASLLIEVRHALRRAEKDERLTSEQAVGIDRNILRAVREHGYDRASLKAFARELGHVACVTPDKVRPGDRLFDHATQRWHEVDETWNDDGLWRVGWVEGPYVYYHRNLGVPRLTGPGESSSALSDMLRRQAPPAGGVPGGWYLLHLYADGTAVDVGEGPWDVASDAVEFAENEVAFTWAVFHAPDGTMRAFDKERERVYRREPEDADPRTAWYVLTVNKRNIASLKPGGPWSEPEARRIAGTVKGPCTLFVAPVGTAEAFKRPRRAGNVRASIDQRS
jgi:hypothetical protein